MKKIFLLLSALVMTVTAAMADTTEFDFEGTGDVYGMTRGVAATANATEYSNLTYLPELTLKQAGVVITATANEGSKGFALANFGNNQAYNGIFIYGATFGADRVFPTFTFSVPNGKVTGVSVVVGRQGLGLATDLDFNGTATGPKSAANYIGTYEWKGEQDEVTFGWTSGFAPTYIHKITVTYTRDLGGKEESGLAFGEEEVQAIVGQTFNAPTFSNPNNLPITWTSSNGAVATVDASGNVTIVAAGTATITAATDGNDKYADGSVSYKITAIPSASNFKEMAAMAPIAGNEVYVNFPVTVTYPSGNNALLIDPEGNATEFHNTKNDENTGSSSGNIYKVGEVIPAGWVATNNLGRNHTHIVWNGLPADPTETVDVVYPVVEKLGYEADADRVVVLKNVVFDAKTQSGDDTKFWGTANGETYQFQNSYGAPAVDAGTYDVTVVVKYNKISSSVYAYLAPIAYVVPSTEDPIVVPATSELKAEMTDGTIAYSEDYEALIGTATTKEDNVNVTLTIPEGFDNFVYMDMTDMLGAGEEEDEDPWIAVSELTANGFTLGNVISVPADGKSHMYGAYIVKDNKAYQGGGYNLMLTATKEVAGPTKKTVTFDFTKENYGIASSIPAKSQFMNYESVVLTNGTVAINFTEGSGIKVGKWNTFTVSSVEGPVTSVTIESITADSDFEVKIVDGVATITNWYEGQAFVSQMTVEFEADGLEDANIAFPAATLQLVNGVGEFKGLVLENPNNVPVTYTSSSADIIVNDKGEVSMAEGVLSGSATITAKFEGNTTYRPAEVSYTLTVVAAANSLAELKTIANKSNVKVYVNFPVVVAYSNGSFAFVQSLDGTESTEIYQSSAGTTYPAESIIPQGWTATSTLSNGFVRYAMSEMPAPVQTQEPKIESVTEITAADVTKVLILKDVEISEETLAKLPAANATGGFSGVDLTVGETTYNIYNQFKVAKPEAAGKYDIKCAVMLYSGAVRLYPIEYTEAVETPAPVSGTVTYDFLADDYGFGRSSSTYIDSGTIIKEGDATLTLTKGNGNGFRMWTDGLRVYNVSKGNPDVMTLAVESAQITKVTMTSKQTSLGTVTINGTEVAADNKTYTWEGDAESVAINVSPTATVAVESITIEYTQLVSGKDAADLSFPAAEFTVGETEAFTKGVLSNPHDLAITWTSSNEEVATVTEEGYIVIKGIGTTTITATSAETDKYAAGKASYKLTVVAAATTVPQMLEKAPKQGDEILMNGTLYVAYANGQYVYVQDLFENATLLYGANSYKVGDVIPGGWVAKNAIYNGVIEWAPASAFPEATSNNPAFIEYPVVDALTTADVNRVVTLKNIAFAEQTPATKASVNITFAGAEYPLYNQFGIEQKEAGNYDVVAAVTLYKDALQLYPIEYKEVAAELVFPDALDITCSFAGAVVTNKKAGDGSLQVTVVADNVDSESFTATLVVPEGWTGFMISDDDPNVVISNGGISTMMRVSTEGWPTVDQMEAYGYTLGNTLTVPVKKDYDANNTVYNSYNVSVMLVKDDKADYSDQIELTIKVNKNPLTGVEAIEAIENGARFFTLDGVEVANPEKGIYVKVVDGKATKVVIR